MIADATGRVLARFYEGETVEVHFDLLGRYLKRHGRPLGGTVGPQVTFAYDAVGRLTNLTRQGGNATMPPPNQVLSTLTYDNDDRLSTITHTYKLGTGGSSTLATYTYNYDAASQLTSEVNQDGTLTYTYDSDAQLTGVDGSGGTCGPISCDESFSFDVNGNRTVSTQPRVNASRK